MTPDIIVGALIGGLVVFTFGAIFGSLSTWRLLKSRRVAANELMATANAVLRNPERWQPLRALFEWQMLGENRSVTIKTDSPSGWRVSLSTYGDVTTLSACTKGDITEAAEQALAKIKEPLL